VTEANDRAISDGRRTPAWWRYRGDGIPAPDGDTRTDLPDPPRWRVFGGTPAQPHPPDDDDEIVRKLGRVTREWARRPDRREGDMVNAAILLRRPLLVTGLPGTGKSSIAFRLARELRLGRVLQWPITSRTTLRSGLYEYDAIGRAQAAAEHTANGDSSIGDFVRLGPLGTALLGYSRPRVLLVDELDKSDIDLPNDLLHIFENGEFPVPELVRARRREPEESVYTDDPDRTATIRDGWVRCHAFPIVVITSNGEREFPPAFLRRCLRLELQPPDADDLATMIRAQLPDLGNEERGLIDDFLARMSSDALARDQLLNAVFLTTSGAYADDGEGWQSLITAVWHSLAAER
jgi:MoxR-like ATPase